MNFEWIKKKILFEVKECEKQNSAFFYKTKKIEIHKCNLQDILFYLNSDELVYWKNKDSSTEVLGADFIEILTKKDFHKKIEKFHEKNEELFFIGGQTFTASTQRNEWNHFPDYYYTLSRIYFVNKKNENKTSIYLNYSDDSYKYFESILNWKVYKKSEKLNSLYKSSLLPMENEWNEMVGKSKNLIEKSQINKIVLSRKILEEFNEKIDPMDVAKKTFQNAEHSYVFFLQIGKHEAFISLTPETLFKKNKKYVEIDSIAGTKKRSHFFQEDQKLEQDLLGSKKEMEEHQFVIDDIFNKLNPLFEKLELKSKEKILKLKYVQHIKSEFEGILKSDSNYVELIDALHPTAAIGGHPWEKVSEYLKQIESSYRGLYSSPIGIIFKDSQEFAVGIRSCLINQKHSYVYAGAGIVRDSQAHEEWIETQEKMRNFI